MFITWAPPETGSPHPVTPRTPFRRVPDALAEGSPGLLGLLDAPAGPDQRAQSGQEGGQTAPRRPQAAPNTHQTPEDGPKTTPQGHSERKKHRFSYGFCEMFGYSVLRSSGRLGPPERHRKSSQKGTQTVQESPKTAQQGPKMSQREPHDGPRWPQDAPRSIPNRDPVVEEDCGSRQSGLRKPPEAPRRRPGGLQRPPRSP